MAHFARIDETNTVIEVLVVPNEQEHRGQEFLADDLGLGGRWIQTSYNNRIRKQFAGIGYVYDESKDIFVAPQPAPWFIFTETSDWICPENINPATGEQYTDDEISINRLLKIAIDYREHEF